MNYYLQVYGTAAGFVDGFYAVNGEERSLVAVSGDTQLEITLVPGSSFSGHVTDEAGRPIAGVSMLAVGIAGERLVVASTDETGAYSLMGLTEGEWRIEASYGALCGNDPSYVAMWWGGVYTAELSPYVSSTLGEEREGLDFVLPIDMDRDMMGDTWEEENGLDPTVDDSTEDNDGDGFTNLEEFRLGTDPTDVVAAKTCGCKAGGKALLLLPLLFWRRNSLVKTNEMLRSHLRTGPHC